MKFNKLLILQKSPIMFFHILTTYSSDTLNPTDHWPGSNFQYQRPCGVSSFTMHVDLIDYEIHN